MAARRGEEQSVPEKLSKFLAETDNEEENQPAGLNAIINSEEEMKMFLLADFLGSEGVKSAEKMHKKLSKHSVGKQGAGRKQIVQAIMKVPNISESEVNRGLKTE